MELRRLIGIVHLAPFCPAVGKCPCDADSADGIQTVGILNDLPFDAVRMLGIRPLERYRFDDVNDRFDARCADPAVCQNTPRVGIIAGAEQFWIVCVMQQSPESHQLPITGYLFGNAHSRAVHPQGVKQIVPAAFICKQRLQFGNDFLFHNASALTVFYSIIQKIDRIIKGKSD